MTQVKQTNRPRSRCLINPPPSFYGLFFLLLVMGCSANGAKSHYILAEKLWNDGKYAPAVSEFERASAQDARGKTGQQALFRGAFTQVFFLSQYSEALRKLQLFVGNPINLDNPNYWEAQKLIGEILFAKLEQYDQAIQHYQALLLKKPPEEEAAEFLFRIGKGHFFRAEFDEAIKAFGEVSKSYSKTAWAEPASFEEGVTFYTRGEQHPGGHGQALETYQEAIDAYEGFIKKFPTSRRVSEAKFGIAACLEEMDQLDAAYNNYEAIKSSYPAPKVIQIRLARIRERKLQRSR
ncbi:tetratricopeptide repeat protein [Bdellovibrionota bacterium FG-2]